jgi:hypothetical protein
MHALVCIHICAWPVHPLRCPSLSSLCLLPFPNYPCLLYTVYFVAPTSPSRSRTVAACFLRTPSSDRCVDRALGNGYVNAISPTSTIPPLSAAHTFIALDGRRNWVTMAYFTDFNMVLSLLSSLASAPAASLARMISSSLANHHQFMSVAPRTPPLASFAPRLLLAPMCSARNHHCPDKEVKKRGRREYPLLMKGKKKNKSGAALFLLVSPKPYRCSTPHQWLCRRVLEIRRTKAQ